MLPYVHHQSGGGFLPAAAPPNPGGQSEMLKVRQSFMNQQMMAAMLGSTVVEPDQTEIMRQAMVARNAQAQCAAAWYSVSGGDDDEEEEPEAPAPKADGVGFDRDELAKAVQKAKELAEAEAARQAEILAKEKEEKERAEQQRAAMEEALRKERELDAEAAAAAALKASTLISLEAQAPTSGIDKELPSSAKIQERVAELATAFNVDPLASMRLASAFIERILFGCKLDDDIGLLAEHLATAGKPSATAMMMMKDLKAGVPIQPCKHYAERQVRQQFRPMDEMARLFHDGGHGIKPEPEPEAPPPDVSHIPKAFRKKLAAKAAAEGNTALANALNGVSAPNAMTGTSKASGGGPAGAVPKRGGVPVRSGATEESGGLDVPPPDGEDEEYKPVNPVSKALDAIRANAERNLWVKPTNAPDSGTPGKAKAKPEAKAAPSTQDASQELVKRGNAIQESLAEIRRSCGEKVDTKDADGKPIPLDAAAQHSIHYANIARNEQDTLLDRARQEFQGTRSGAHRDSPPRRSARSGSRRRQGDDRSARSRSRRQGGGQRGYSRSRQQARERANEERGGRARSRSRRRSRSGRAPRNTEVPPPRSRSRPKDDKKAESSLSVAVEAAASEVRRKRVRKSNWDEPSEPPAQTGGFGSAPSSGMPLQTINTPPSYAGPPSSKNYKTIKMTGVQIRALLGPGGADINRLRRQSGCDIQVHHRYPEPEGNVSVVGSVAVGEKMIAALLAERGCPLMANGECLMPEEMEEVPIAAKMVGLFIGKGGEKLREIQDLCGGGINIKIQPPAVEGGLQAIRIVGPNRVKAKQIIQMKVDAIKCGYSEDKPNRGTSNEPANCIPLP